nr:MAG TPA: hypothetical protein [Caudoviricetes sp.]
MKMNYILGLMVQLVNLVLFIQILIVLKYLMIFLMTH